MTILRPQFFRGALVATGDRIETESRKVAAVLTKLGRAREVPDFDRSEPFNLPDAAEMPCKAPADCTVQAEINAMPKLAFGMDLASKDDQVAIVSAKRAYKKRAYKRRGPAKRK